MFEKLRNLFTKQEANKPKSESTPRPKKEKIKLSEKEQATLNNEPYIAITKVDVDPNNINSGAFELDWNDKFVLNLVKAGYKQRPDDTDQTIVDRWFQTVCRNIALEIYEQQNADPMMRDMEDVRRVYTKDIGNGRTEIG